MRRILLISLVCFISTQSIRAQLVSYELVQNWGFIEMAEYIGDFGVPQILVFALEHEVATYKIIYETPDPWGNMTTASGIVSIPLGLSCMPLCSYQHGTTFDSYEVPSYNSDELAVGLLFSAKYGYAVAMSDYLGMGESTELLHPYHHAKSTATSCLDMIRATKQVVDDLYLTLNNQLFLFGYSQGGHSTMALHREIEQFHSDEFTITASVPMSGAHDLSGVQADMIRNLVPYPSPAYLPYLVLGINPIYNLYNNTSEYFIPPYDSLFNLVELGIKTFDEVDSEVSFPDIPAEMIVPSQFDAFLNDPNHPLQLALEDNDVYKDWVPTSPMFITSCLGDDQVTFWNSVVAYQTFLANGADPNIVQNQTFGLYDHILCIIPSILNAIDYLGDFENVNVTCSPCPKPRVSTFCVRPRSCDNTPINVDWEDTPGAIGYEFYGRQVSGSPQLQRFTSQSGFTVPGNVPNNYPVEIQLRAICGVGDTSEWTVLHPYTISTNACATCVPTASTPLATSADDLQQSKVIWESPNNKQLHIFPNPTNNDLYIRMPSNNSVDQIEVYDLLGKRQFIKNIELVSGNQLQQLDVSNLETGYYILKVRTEQEEYAQQFIVQ